MKETEQRTKVFVAPANSTRQCCAKGTHLTTRRAKAFSEDRRASCSIRGTGNLAPLNSLGRWTRTFAGTTRSGSRSRWAIAVQSSTDEAWDSLLRQSKFLSTSPTMQFTSATHIALKFCPYVPICERKISRIFLLRRHAASTPPSISAAFAHKTGDKS